MISDSIIVISKISNPGIVVKTGSSCCNARIMFQFSSKGRIRGLSEHTDADLAIFPKKSLKMKN